MNIHHNHHLLLSEKTCTWKQRFFYCTIINIILLQLTSTSAFIQSSLFTQRLRLTLSTPTSQENNYEIIALSSSSSPPSSIQNVCTHCGKSFETRNSLFRHLRNDLLCSNANKSDSSKTSIPIVIKRDTIAILCTYDSYLRNQTNFTTFTNNPSDAETAGKMICNAFDLALEKQFREYQENPKVIGSTQSSVARLRVKSLGLENGVGAASDVLTLTYQYPVKKSLLDEKKSFQEKNRIETFHKLKMDATNNLANIQENCRFNTTLSSYISNVHILSAIMLPSDKKIHAESHCTQRVYHYLMPVKWILGGDKIEEWWLKNREYDKTPVDNNSKGIKFGIKGGKRLVARPPNELRAFKDVLRSFESQEIEKGQENNNDLDRSKNRFGNLASKSFRAWHNFADPTIRGAAVSPNNRPVWRSLDRCRIVKFLALDDLDAINNVTMGSDNEVMALIEFRGDDFVQQQVRRIVGTAVAINNGWLPKHFADVATRPDVFIETPLAPQNRMYQTRPRFHFDELSNKGRSMFYEDINENDEVILTEAFQKIIIHRCLEQAAEEKKWYWTIKEQTAPRICEQIKVYLDTLTTDQSNSIYLNQSICPPQYMKTLTILQNILISGQWPVTSMARSRVIKEGNNKDQQKINQGGSFTIINPNYLSGILLSNDSSVKQPLGNVLFPELVSAVFELEEQLSIEMADITNSKQRRQPSSHCAINCNAEFTPHVDSGRGSGQSLSMIVGLGSYSGGSLIIEDHPFDIHYKPKQFDGWRERHWTQQFQGERYSLVWFTPEMKGINIA